MDSPSLPLSASVISLSVVTSRYMMSSCNQQFTQHTTMVICLLIHLLQTSLVINLIKGYHIAVVVRQVQAYKCMYVRLQIIRRLSKRKSCVIKFRHAQLSNTSGSNVSSSIPLPQLTPRHMSAVNDFKLYSQRSEEAAHEKAERAKKKLGRQLLLSTENIKSEIHNEVLDDDHLTIITSSKLESLNEGINRYQVLSESDVQSDDSIDESKMHDWTLNLTAN
ncbi:hypothetical protein K501DRAFT_277228 [Backusella circina FSU 941]|nr:hypothetical protein K501DRAFT_277228 [Backusella circina FSU 941]